MVINEKGIKQMRLLELAITACATIWGTLYPEVADGMRDFAVKLKEIIETYSVEQPPSVDVSQILGNLREIDGHLRDGLSPGTDKLSGFNTALIKVDNLIAQLDPQPPQTNPNPRWLKL